MPTRVQNILQQVSSFDILNHYLKPYHNFGELTKGTHISNPLISTKQNTPSFNIFQCSNTGEWKFKDFATADKGSCFDLVMRLYDLEFIEALERIESDFNIKNEQSKTRPAMSLNNNYSITPKEFTQTELDFWGKYGITPVILDKYKVVSLSQYTSISKKGNEYTITAKRLKPIFAYKNDKWAKIYKPFDDKKFKFQHLGEKENNFIFGWDQLPENGDNIFLTGGEKDTMTLASNNFNAISLNSETALPTPETIKVLKERFNNIFVLYDNDNTGITQSDKICSGFGLRNIVLPKIKNNGKDISDFFKEGHSLKELNELIIASLIEPEPVSNPLEFPIITEEIFDKVVYNAVELLSMGNLKPKYLMEPIFPQKGSAVLAGKPDTGKSQFARHLCIAVSNRHAKFLNFILSPIHYSAIYVATEDSKEATQFLVSRQLEGLKEKEKDSLRFIFADTMEQKEIIENLDKELTKSPADLVVVDSFGDIFTGTDSNNSIAMRNTVKSFDKLAKKHNNLILFVHHINKGAYRQSPGQEHIQGGAGLTQKVRLALQLSEGDGLIKYLSVVKGNYCPKSYKENSFILEFSEEHFLFKDTGNTIPTADIGVQPGTDTKEEKYYELVEIAKTMFSTKELLSYGNLAKEYCDITNKSTPTAKRTISTMVKFEILKKINGAYQLNKDIFQPVEIDDLDDEIEF